MSDDRLAAQLRALADAVPPPGPAVRDAEIRRAIAGGHAAPVPRRRVLPWIALGVGVAAAAVLVLWLRTGGAPADLVVEGGTTDAPLAIGTEVAVVGTEPVLVRTADGSSVVAAPETRLARTDAAAAHWRLARGRVTLAVTKRAPGTTFEVATDEATVTVVGTRFTVERTLADGRAATRVAVEEGVVRVTPRGAAAVTLTAGQTWPPTTTAAVDASPPPAREPAPADAGSDLAAPADSAAGGAAEGALVDAGSESRPGRPDRPAPDAGTPPVPAFDARAIRSAIRAGNVADARRQIDDQRRAHASKRAVLAELGILAAEADLAERKTRAAIDKYLAVVADFPTTAQAEQALFAAAQLAIDRPDAGYKPAALLRDYLDTYPRGQFAKDAERLLAALAR